MKTEDLHVGHWRERLLDAGEGGGEGQEGAHAQRHPGRGGLVVDPEGEPGDEDDDDAGDVHGDQEVGQLPGEHQVHLETAVLPGSREDIAVVLPHPAHSLLHSHWSSSNEAWLSLVEKFIVLLAPAI